MKKALCISLVLILLLCGCNTVLNGGESTTEGTTTQTSDMPEIKKEVKVSRWYEEFTDTLIPRNDYGELVIFTGGYIFELGENFAQEQLFGLMTLDGKIVVDPVFNSHYTYELDGKKYYSMIISEHELYEGGEYECTSMLVASDGSWCVTVDGDIDHITPERIFTSKYDKYFKCYDYDGNIVFEGGDNLDYAWNHGTSSHTKLMGAYNDLEDGIPLFIFDMDGNVVFDEFDFFVSFESGKSVVKVTETQLYGIITDSGEWLLEPVYSYIDSVAEDKYFIAVRDNKEVAVYDNELKLLRTFTTVDYDNEDRYYCIVDGRLLYYYNDADVVDEYLYDMLTDEAIVCKENGLQATYFSDKDNIFCVTDENGTEWYFDIDGNVTDKIQKPEDADWVTLYNSNIIQTRTDIDEEHYTETYYNRETGKEIYTITGNSLKRDTIDFLDFNGCENLAVIGGFVKHEWPYTKHINKLVNYKTGEVFLENCEHIKISEYGGKQFLTVVYKDYIYIYDEDFNLIMGTENVLCD